MRQGMLLGLTLSFCLLGGDPLAVWAGKEKAAPPTQVRWSQETGVGEVVFQPGTVFLLIAETPVHTGENQLNDPVEARLVHDVYVGESRVISRSARFWGYLSQLEPPVEGRDAVLGIRMRELQLPNGMRLPLVGYIHTGNDKQVWGGGETEGTKPRLVQHRVQGIGYYNKVVMAGPLAMGRHYRVQPGEYWRVVLEEPLSIPFLLP